MSFILPSIRPMNSLKRNGSNNFRPLNGSPFEPKSGNYASAPQNDAINPKTGLVHLKKGPIHKRGYDSGLYNIREGALSGQYGHQPWGPEAREKKPGFDHYHMLEVRDLGNGETVQKRTDLYRGMINKKYHENKTKVTTKGINGDVDPQEKIKITLDRRIMYNGTVPRYPRNDKTGNLIAYQDTRALDDLKKSAHKKWKRLQPEVITSDAFHHEPKHVQDAILATALARYEDAKVLPSGEVQPSKGAHNLARVLRIRNGFRRQHLLRVKKINSEKVEGKWKSLVDSFVNNPLRVCIKHYQQGLTTLPFELSALQRAKLRDPRLPVSASEKPSIYPWEYNLHKVSVDLEQPDNFASLVANTNVNYAKHIIDNLHYQHIAGHHHLPSLGRMDLKVIRQGVAAIRERVYQEASKKLATEITSDIVALQALIRGERIRKHQQREKKLKELRHNELMRRFDNQRF